MQRLVAVCFGLLLGVLGATDASASPILYATAGQTGSDSLLTIDPLTGAITNTIGNIGFSVTGLAMDPVTGILYGVTTGLSNPNSLITIDTSTGAGSLVGATGRRLSDIAFSPTGTLYAVGRGAFGTLNVGTGAFSLISASFDGGGITFDAAGNLYYSRFLNSLITIDPATGATLSTQATGISVDATAALAFDPTTGVIFGVDRPLGNSTLFRMTPVGAAVGSPGAPLDAIAFATEAARVPEPGTLFLCSAGAAMVLRRRLASKRRQRLAA